MNALQRLHQWDITHPIVHLFFRIVLGLLLLLKGIAFTSNAQYLDSMLQQSGFSTINVFIVSYVTFTHIFGGVFIAIGLFTRLAIILQMPVLIGAVFLVNTGMPAISIGELIFSIMVMFLMIYYLLNGSGAFSVDEFIKD